MIATHVANLLNKILVASGGIGLIIQAVSGLPSTSPALQVWNSAKQPMYSVDFAGNTRQSGSTLIRGTLTANGAATFGSTLGLGGRTYTFPASGGSSGYVLKTNGADGLSWGATATAGGGVSSGGVLTISDPRFVNTSGDTMTGALRVRSTVSGSTVRADTNLFSSGALSVEGTIYSDGVKISTGATVVTVCNAATSNVTTNACTYVTDGTADNVEIQAAINAARTASGSVFVKSGRYTIASPIDLKSNVPVRCEGKNSTVFQTWMAAQGAAAGMFKNNDQDNAAIVDCGFNVGGATPAIVSYGHNGFTIRGNRFTGTGATNTEGVIVYNGNSGSDDFVNGRIEGNDFVDMPNTPRVVRLYARNGNQVLHTKITGNHFENTRAAAIYLDDYDVIRGTIVTGNNFKDLTSGVTPTTPGVAVFAGIGLLQTLIEDLNVSNNEYYNSITTAGHQQGFVYFYSASGVIISNNTIAGSWTPAQATQGPAIAPGRINTPAYNITITGNTIRGFDAAWDPDSMINVEVANNIVANSGSPFSTGYGHQRNVNIHHNVAYNSPMRDDSVPGSRAAVMFGSPLTAKKITYSYNTHIDDRSPGVMTGAIFLSDNFDYSDYMVHGNRFYSPNATFINSGALFIKFYSTAVVPKNTFSNEIEDSTGKKLSTDNFGNASGATLHASNQLRSSGALTVQTTGLFKGNLTTRGTLSGQSLHVTGSGANPLLFTKTSNGRVGIGTTSPAQALQVVGTVQASDYRITQGNSFFFDTSSSVHYAKYDNTSSLDGIFINGFGGVDLGAAGTHVLRVNSTGVGIGTTAPETKLDVLGTISGSSLVISGLRNCDTIDTNASGTLSCGTDAGGGSGLTISDGDVRYVNVGGDTMTGALTIKKSSGTGTGNTLIVDTLGLVYDATNKRVGIGTASPSEALHIVKANGILRFDSNGAGFSGLRLTNGSSTVAEYVANGATGEVRMGGVLANYFPTLYSNGSEIIRILTNGNVGIRSTAPETALEVGGTMSGKTLNLTGSGSLDSLKVIAAQDAYMLAGYSGGNQYVGLRKRSNHVELQSFTSLPLEINPQGNNVAIGSKVPSTKLEVVGSMSGSSLAVSNLSACTLLQTSSAGALSCLNNYAGQNTITTLGTVTTGTWNATTIGISKGGTNLTALPTKTVILSGAGGIASTTNGASQKTVTFATNGVDARVMEFGEAGAARYAQWTATMPDSYDGGTLTFAFNWTTPATSGDIKWYVQCRSLGDGEAIDQSWGTAVGVTDTAGTADTVRTTSTSAAVTCAGTPAGGEVVQFRVYRDSADAADTMSGSGRLLTAKGEYAVSSYSD